MQVDCAKMEWPVIDSNWLTSLPKEKQISFLRRFVVHMYLSYGPSGTFQICVGPRKRKASTKTPKTAESVQTQPSKIVTLGGVLITPSSTKVNSFRIEPSDEPFINLQQNDNFAVTLSFFPEYVFNSSKKNFTNVTNKFNVFDNQGQTTYSLTKDAKKLFGVDKPSLRPKWRGYYDEHYNHCCGIIHLDWFVSINKRVEKSTDCEQLALKQRVLNRALFFEKVDGNSRMYNTTLNPKNGNFSFDWFDGKMITSVNARTIQNKKKRNDLTKTLQLYLQQLEYTNENGEYVRDTSYYSIKLVTTLYDVRNQLRTKSNKMSDKMHFLYQVLAALEVATATENEMLDGCCLVVIDVLDSTADMQEVLEFTELSFEPVFAKEKTMIDSVKKQNKKEENLTMSNKQEKALEWRTKRADVINKCIETMEAMK